MCKALTVAILIGISLSPVFPQTDRATDREAVYSKFAGNWTLERQRDKAFANRQTTLTIERDGPQIKIISQTSNGTNNIERELIYYSDGRGEQNDGIPMPTLGGITDGQIRSQTRWQGTTLRTNATVRKQLGGRFLSWKIFSEWKLSDDGQTLTHNLRITPEIDNGHISGTGRPRSLPRAIIIARPAEMRYVFRRNP